MLNIYNVYTCTLDSFKDNFLASSSRQTTPGYGAFRNAFSISLSWNEVNVVLLKTTNNGFKNLHPTFALKIVVNNMLILHNCRELTYVDAKFIDKT